MKHLIIALSFFSLPALASPCEQLFSETPFVTSGTFASVASTTPEPAEGFKRSVIAECESAIAVGAQGMPVETVAAGVLSGYKHGGAFNSLMTATRIQLVMSGWAIGAEGKK